MDAIKISLRCTAPAIAAALAACSGGGGYGGESSGMGSLTVALRDAPVSDVAEVWVRFDGLTLRGSGAPIEITFDAPIDVDLLTLTGDNTEILLDAEQVPAGFYTQLALHVSAEHDGVFDSYVVTNAGGQEEIFVPSGTQTGLKIVDGLTITADQETSFLIDWDVRLGIIDPPGLPGRILRPTLRVMDMTEFGTLRGIVADALVMDASCTNDLNLDTGNAVYVYERFDFTLENPDDIDGTVGPTPVATATVSQGQNGYAYEVILSPGDYTVAFTCQADDEAGADEAIAFVQPTDVAIVDGATADLNF